jgi:excisionase family DNA binding protein
LAVILLTPEQVSERFQIRVRQVKELARQGRIPAIKIGRTWRFSEAVLVEWVRNGRKDNLAEINHMVDRIIREVSS